MKKCLPFILFVISIIILMSCSGNQNESMEKSPAEESAEIKNEVQRENSPLEDKLSIKPANITVKIFFRDLDMSGYEGYEDFKPRTYEIESFRKERKYTFCYDSAEFNKLQISGNGEEITIEVRNENKIIFSKSGFNVNEKINFTNKDFYFSMGDVYTITIKQNKNILFEGKINSQGCM